MKNLSKKIISLVLVASMLVSTVFLNGCSNTKVEETVAATENTEETTEAKVVVENPADMIVTGHIITMDDNNMYAEAVACKDGKIMYVGSLDGVKEFQGENTLVYNYDNDYVYPGFLDAHEHGVLCGWRTLGQANLLECQSYDEYVEVFKKYIEENPGKDYYMASGWRIIGEEPTYELLDRVSTDIPLIANSGDGHSMLLNSKGMELCEFSKDMVKEFSPGEIKVDKDGNPTGVVSEEPAIWLLNHMPLTKDDIKSFILTWQDYAFAHGYTGGGEAGTKIFTELQDEAYAELGKEGKLKFRTYSYATIDDNTDTPEEDVEKLVEIAKNNDSEFYKTIGFKAFIDGVLEASTSWLKDEYKNKPGYHGVSRFNDHDKMVRLITAASKHNMGVHVHSIGDAATEFMLNCIEDSQKETGNLDQRNAIAHLQHVQESDFERFASTNTVAVTPPLWVAAAEGLIDQEIEAVGYEKAMTDYPIGSFVKAGAPMVFHSDYPAGFVMNVPASVYMAKNRIIDKKTASILGINPILRGADERISGKEAVLALTKNVAYMFHEEDKLGSIEVGKCADFSVFPFNFIDDEIKTTLDAYDIEPVATIVDAKVVYENK